MIVCMGKNPDAKIIVPEDLKETLNDKTSRWIMYIESETMELHLIDNLYREIDVCLPENYDPSLHNDTDYAVDYVIGVIGREFRKLLKFINPDALDWFIWRDIYVWSAELEINTEKGKYEDRFDQVINGFVCELLQVRMVRRKDRQEILSSEYLVETYPEFAKAIRDNDV